MQKAYIGVIILVTIVAIILLGRNQTVENTSSDIQESQSLDYEMSFTESEYDFGVIKQSGGIVTHDFEFTYNGDIEREIVAVVGSCACTTGEINVQKLIPGEKGIITVSFDPNLHGEPEGRFFKTVSVLTEPALENADVKIWLEIDLDLGPEAFKLQQDKNNDEKNIKHSDNHSVQDYGEVHAQELKDRLKNKDFFLLDVHIPEQKHIEGTDAFIDYRKVASSLDKLPEDKNTEIIIYCRSGSMSQIAAQTLIDAGYTNVNYLEGGTNEFNKISE